MNDSNALPFNKTARGYGSVWELDHLINVALDTSSMPARDVVVQTVASLAPEALKKISQPTLMRMMDEMSRHAHECRGLGVKSDKTDLDAGYALICAIDIPPEFLQTLRHYQDRLESRITGYGNFRQRDPDSALAKPEFEGLCKRFLIDFTQCFDMQDVPQVRFIDDPLESLGVCSYDSKTGRSIVKINLYHVKSVRDLPKLIMTLGHEGMHAYGNAVTHGRVNLAPFAQDWKTQFTMTNLFNALFYSTQREDVYFKHAEEHLAELNGVRLAARTIKRMGLPINVRDFQETLLFLNPQTVANILNEVIPPPKSSGITL